MNKATAALFERLVTVTCRKQAHEAIKYEGPAAMESSFGVLGEVAMKGLMSHPEVGEGFQEFSNFVDNEKIRRLVEEPGE